MKLFRGLGALTWAYLLETVRSKTVLFWNLVFPLVFVIGFSLIFGGGEPQRVGFILPGIITINIIAASFFGISMHLVTLREHFYLRRYRVTPLSSAAIVMAHVLTGLITTLVSIVVQVLVAMAVFKIDVAGSYLNLALVSMVAALAFIPLGLFVGCTAKDIKTAPAISNLLFFPMMFLSGAAIPLFMLPEWIKQVAALLPATYVVEVLQGVMIRGDQLGNMLVPLLVLILTGITAFLVNALMFRWESTEPVNKRNLLISLVMLVAIYAAAFLAGPTFKAAVNPNNSADALRQGYPGAENIRSAFNC